MRRTLILFAMTMAAFWTLLPACGKSGKTEDGTNKKTESVSTPQGATSPARTTGAAKTQAPATGDNAGQGEVVDGTGPQLEVVSLDNPINDKSYHLTVTGPAQVQKGKPAFFEVTLTPKNPYHTNKLFPFELSFGNLPAGVTLDKTLYRKKDAALFSPEKAVFKVKVTAKGNLPVTVSGLYKFSVCTPKFCETPKAKVLLTVGKKAAKAGPAATHPVARGKTPRAGRTPARK